MRINQNPLKALIIIGVMMSIGQTIFAQNIIAYEYWFDNNLNSSQTKILNNPSTDVSILDSVDISALTFGLHTFNFRVKSQNGKWNAPVTNYFFKSVSSTSNKITHYEYWLNQEFRRRRQVRVNVPTNDLVVMDSVNIDSVCRGRNTVSFRFKSGNLWSPVVTDTFISQTLTPISATARFDFVTDGRTVFFIDSTRNVDRKEWNFGDNTPLSIESNPHHIYANFGVYNVCLRGIGNCGDTTFCRQVVIKGIKEVTPNRVADSGRFVLTLRGGFPQVQSVRLAKLGQSSILADSFRMLQDSAIVAYFKFNRAGLGNWDLILNYVTPTNLSDTLKSGLTIETRTNPSISIGTSNNTFLRNRPTPVKIAVTNNSNQNIYAVPVTIALGGRNNIKLKSPYIKDGLKRRIVDSMSNFQRFQKKKNSRDSISYGNFRIPALQPFETRYIDIEVTNYDFGEANLEVSTKNLTFTAIDNFISDGSTYDCFQCGLEVAALTVPGGGCALSVTQEVISKIADESKCNLVAGENCNAEKRLYDYSLGTLGVIEKCASDISGLDDITKGIKFIKAAYDIAHGEEISASLATALDLGNCAKCLLPERFQNKINIVSSIDPNLKVGPTGSGTPNRYIKGDAPMNYTVYFENADSATSAALEVVIKDQLDTSAFDLNTFAFTGFNFGNQTFNLTGIKDEYVRDIDMRPAKNIILRVRGKLDKQKGTITQAFSSFDPQTMDLTYDLSQGFLPPNRNKPEGEGYMTYSVRLRDTLQHGKIIRNKADIYFDFNDPIPTPTWLNTLDKIKPQSRVQNLAATQRDTFITIRFTGSDVGAGVASYQLYVSENNQPFILVGYTEGDSMRFKGRNRSNYRFFAIALDKAGNIENTKVAAETSTTIDLNTGIYAIEDIDFLNIYPNPTSDKININWRIQKPNETEIKLLDLIGNVILTSKKEFLDSGEYVRQINLENIAKGLYFIQFNANGQKVIKKIIVQ